MSPTGRPRPHRLATRADSPMREEVHIVSPPPANGSTPHGLPTPANDVPSKGFTAVNGESRTMSFRPDASARPTVITNMNNGDLRQNGGETPSAHSSYTPHNWRPDERSVEAPRSHPQLETGSKRRRVESPPRQNEDSRDEHGHRSGPHSPKRRMGSGGRDGYPSPERTIQSRPYSPERQDSQPARNERARSPIRANRTEPPPPPDPSIEAGLAASLRRTVETDSGHQGEQRAQNEQSARPGPRSESPPDPDSPDSADGQQQYGTDAGQSGDNDPKKRKRNFSNRTKTGCHTCRARKKKCDEGKPICENCKRGAFECGGYGAKPPGGSKVSALKQNVPIQARQHFDQMHGAPPYHGPPPHHYPHSSPRPPMPWEPARLPDGGVPSHHYGPPPPMDHRPPSVRDAWGPRPAWGADPNPSYLSERLPPVDYSSVPPPHTYQGRYQDFRPPPPDPWAPQHHQSRLPPGPTLNISSRESVRSSHSGGSNSHLRMLPPSGPPSEKTKMLTGQPFKRYMDPEIQLDRKSCSRAVEAYNNACAASSPASANEQVRHFKSIIDPSQRTFLENLSTRWTGPIGNVGARTIVLSPFNCDFGYNIHLGNDTLIEANCSMQDAGLVVIGDRVIVGPNVSFCCITASVDMSLRSGSQGEFVAGAIKVEDDVYIGANVTVMPFRTIGKGAVVGAGSVVTRDVKPGTVVAGNPAKLVRKRKIESGPNVDRHDDSIQEENEKMLEWMKKKHANPIRPVGEGM